jgi:thioredoxin reductase (NADPH)
MDKIYDVIILGGGPASMSAGVYCKQMGLNTLLIEKSDFGGQVATTSSVSNYLGFKNISGEELSRLMHEHIESTGIEIVDEEVTQTSLSNEIKVIHTHNNMYKSQSVIIGIGTSVRNLGIDNEKKYIGSGISYSTLRDREKYEGRIVGVVGGGNSAIEDALYLSQKCEKVYIIHRRQEFRGDSQLVEKLQTTSNIELVLDCKPHTIVGDEKVSAIEVIHIPTQEIRKIDLDCIFVAIGRGADTDIIDSCITRDSSGYIVTDEKMNTNISGVYAIGDIRNTPLRQIVTAVSDGAISALSAYNYIKEIRKQKVIGNNEK